ncbi:unnamed protein product [Owenia fusiformis]|uniref:Uncharacterized protein n=1 Tax=Owenia fusiformis TaxID=6347 RepID=A0A8J1TR79_OWEFU|nr:unnamed protein product [Owenia fusiformis]
MDSTTVIKAMLFLLTISACVSVIITKPTDENSKWIFRCGPSQTKCDKRTHFCESRMDQCNLCFDYCSENRIKGNLQYQQQCHEFCSVWMRDQEKAKQTPIFSTAEMTTATATSGAISSSATTEQNQTPVTNEQWRTTVIVACALLFMIAMVFALKRCHHKIIPHKNQDTGKNEQTIKKDSAHSDDEEFNNDNDQLMPNNVRLGTASTTRVDLPIDGAYKNAVPASIT